MIKAIETKYKGYRFRSRLEARWAVFFESIRPLWSSGFIWEYEPEGFNLGDGGLYLPDFKISYGVHYCYVEIKGKKPTEEEFEKGKKIASHTQKPFYFLCQIPDPDNCINGAVIFDGWVFIPANCGFILSDPHFSMFDFYRKELSVFLRCSPWDCFGADNEYYKSKYGEPHPYHCALGRMSKIGVEAPFFMKACRVDHDNFIRDAAQKARSARFEHGESP